MSRRVIALAALAAALVVTPAAAEAQSPVRFGIAAGATLPTGDAGDVFDVGYHVTGLVSGRPSMSPVGIRGEFMWHSLGASDVDADLRVLAGILNAEITMTGTTASPYFIGGLGMYNSKITSDNDLFESDGETDFGFNVGAGINFNLSGFGTFAEVRFHSIQTEGDATNIVPLTFGIRF